MALNQTRAAEPVGFETIFDGRSFDGWLGQDMSFWTIEDGAITGTISPEHAPRMNQYLIWQRELLQDFELQLEFRFTACSARNENGGFQFRSRRLPNGDVAGYQVDNNFGTPWKVRLYDEHGRHDLALEGEQTVFDREGRKLTEKLTLEPGASDFKLNEWHRYHLVARGPQLILSINDKRVAEVLDQDPDSYEPAGVLGLQLHTGPPMKVQFRNIRYKRLIPAVELSSRPRLLLQAALHWNLGERINSHQPPLKPMGKVKIGAPAAGSPDTRPMAVALLDRGGFSSDMALNDCKTWNISGHALTVFARARITDGRWDGALLTKGQLGGAGSFYLGGGTNSEIVFEIRTKAGAQSVGFPSAKIARGEWHDLIGGYDGARLQLWCDGQVMAEVPVSGAVLPSEAPFLLGAEAGREESARLFKGELDEVALWDHALTRDEIELLGRRSSK